DADANIRVDCARTALANPKVIKRDLTDVMNITYLQGGKQILAGIDLAGVFKIGYTWCVYPRSMDFYPFW
ncbi:MAG TPA: hypothetical protein VGS58_19335, partial [Candidatus Sulfopaludibacter sp.]|nr:hypothetical protein [Candidatus Sulfopaludibacter sp.]